MLVDRANLLVLKCCGDPKDVDRNAHIQVSTRESIGTDGRMLVSVRLPVAQPDLFTPTVEVREETVNVQHEVASAALKLIDKSGESPQGHAIVGADDVGRCVVANIGAENLPIIQNAAQPVFPNVKKQVAPPKSKPVFEIALDCDLLKHVAEVAAAGDGTKILRLSFYGPEAPIHFRSHVPDPRVTGIIAPSRLDVFDDKDEE